MISNVITKVAHFATIDEKTELDEKNAKAFVFKMMVAKTVSVAFAILSFAFCWSSSQVSTCLFGGLMIVAANDLYQIFNNCQNIADGMRSTMPKESRIISKYMFKDTKISRLLLDSYVNDQLEEALQKN